MCFLFQVLLFAGAAGSAEAVHALLNAPFWAAGVGGFAFLVIAWITYLRYQAKFPQWYPPWDEGLPQSSRMLNAFVPVAGVFLLALFLVPVFQKAARNAGHRARTHHKHSGMSRNNSGNPVRVAGTIQQ